MKRVLDVTLSALALVLFSPVLLLLWVSVRRKLGSPAIFAQERPGLDGKIFTMYKFRSMTDEKDEDGRPLPDEARLTPFGRRLRSASLDELPALWNVLKGEMSLVGPRPLLVQYLNLYTERQARRHEVAPGLTGWAQINGRNAISWEEKFELDVWYVDHRSLWLDFKILCATAARVFKREGISSGTSATMEAFTGSENEEGSLG